MAPFTAAFNGTNYEALIVGSKVYHALLSALMYAVFFVLAWKLLRHRTYAFVATISLFASSEIFSFRSILPRPHLISIIIILCAYFYCIREKKKSLFVLNVISPFTYSISFMSVVPGIIYALVVRKWWPALLSVGGLLVGIALRPESFNYIYNGYYVHLMSLLNTSLLGRAGPGELKAGEMILHREVWIFVYVFVLGYAAISYLIYREKGKNYIPWNKEEQYTLAMSFLFYLPFIFVIRTIEYLLPFAILLIFLIFKNHIIPLVNKFVQHILPQSADRLYTYLIVYPQKILQRLQYKDTRVVFKCVAVTFLLMGCIYQLGYKNRVADSQSDPMIFAQITNYLKSHSRPGEVVSYMDFGMYTRLVFFNSMNQYPIGIDPMFTYAYDPAQYWTWYHLVVNEPTCSVKKCTPETEKGIYAALHEDVRAQYFLLDLTDYGNSRRLKNGTSTIAEVTKDKRFEEVVRVFDSGGSMVLYKIH